MDSYCTYMEDDRESEDCLVLVNQWPFKAQYIIDEIQSCIKSSVRRKAKEGQKLLVLKWAG